MEQQDRPPSNTMPKVKVKSKRRRAARPRPCPSPWSNRRGSARQRPTAWWRRIVGDRVSGEGDQPDEAPAQPAPEMGERDLVIPGERAIGEGGRDDRQRPMERRNRGDGVADVVEGQAPQFPEQQPGRKRDRAKPDRPATEPPSPVSSLIPRPTPARAASSFPARAKRQAQDRREPLRGRVPASRETERIRIRGAGRRDLSRSWRPDAKSSIRRAPSATKNGRGVASLSRVQATQRRHQRRLSEARDSAVPTTLRG